MSTFQNNHPLPPPPTGQPQPYSSFQPQPQTQPQPPQPEQRQRSKSSFSLRSDKSHKSSGSVPKIDLHETAKEKASHKLNPSTKADPSTAMLEAEPSAVATGQKTSLAPLRAIVHLDATGNPIDDPDRSNPTRSRWERPLDTIRAFEAAIDGSYSRKPYNKAESVDSSTGYNRRSSYYGAGSNIGGINPRYPQESWAGGRPNSYRPDSYIDNRGISNGMPRNDGYYDNNAKPSNGYYPNRARYPRTASEPHFNSGTGIYPVPGNQQSYETVTTASGSGSSGDPLGYTTDPSSENSSLDRVQAAGYVDQMGLNGMHQYGSPNLQLNNYGSSNYSSNNYGSNNYSSNNHGGYPVKQSDMNGGYPGQNRGLPPLPQKERVQEPPRVPIRLSTSTSMPPQSKEMSRPGVGEKRKSWFGLKRKA